MKQSPIRHKPKRGRKALIAQADRLIQQVAIAMAGGVCQFPGCNAQPSEGHHVVHRDNHALRWVAANVPGLCHDHHSWDDGPKKGALLKGIIERMGGESNYEALVLYGNTQSGEDPRDAIDRLQKVLDK